MRVLVTGGAGYIGSHTAKQLFRSGHEPVVLDNFSNGHRWAVRWGPLAELDLGEEKSLHLAFEKYRFGAVIHFAAFAYVGESMTHPAEYFRNNVVNTITLLDAMRAHGLPPIVFSSSCATYGNPRQKRIAENHPQSPVNPYGDSKLIVEKLLSWYGHAYGLRWTVLRYFNAAGADPDGEVGELHRPETHLIPRAIAAAQGDLPEVEILGADYPTGDGTAVRDYVHVADLARAHVRALERLLHGGPSRAFNLGAGRGHSVREVIAAVEQVTGRNVPVKVCPRRPGDPTALVANVSRARVELDWVPGDSSLVRVIETASHWHNYVRSSRLSMKAPS